MKIAESKRNIFRKENRWKISERYEKTNRLRKKPTEKKSIRSRYAVGCDDSFFGFLALCKSELYFNGV